MKISSAPMDRLPFEACVKEKSKRAAAGKKAGQNDGTGLENETFPT